MEMRAWYQGTAQATFAIGEIYAAIMIIYFDWGVNDLSQLPWRTLIMLCALPALMLFILSYLKVYESPVYLAQT